MNIKKTVVDLRKIKSLMGANDHTKKFIASYLELTQTASLAKLRGKVEYKALELKKLSELYNISVDELFIEEV